MQSLSPKKRFQATPDAKAHADLVTSNVFLNAVTAALLQMQMEMPGTENPAQAWDKHCQMTGAKKVIEILLNLSEPAQEIQRLPSKNLSSSHEFKRPEPQTKE